MRGLVEHVRGKRWANGLVIVVRILIAFALLPAALKKVLGQPFTDPTKTGAFHDFLHAFLATGWFYRFVGVVQLVAAVLLASQRFAAVGALIALPVFTAISAFCWSTGVYPTATIASLLLAGTAALLVWEWPRWRGLAPVEPVSGRWQRCGFAVFALYLGVCVAKGGVYRPRGIDVTDPAWWVFPVIAMLPIVTAVFEARARRLTPG